MFRGGSSARLLYSKGAASRRRAGMPPGSPRQPVVDVTLLGGVGEFGMNMAAVGCGGIRLLVDAGVTFPDADAFGVDVVVPDPAALRADGRRLAAAVLTHGHEDHIGALPYVWDEIGGPVYGSPLTLALAETKLQAHGIDTAGRLVTATPGATATVGPLRVEFIRVTHSIPDSLALAIHTPVGTLVHTGDFKLDSSPPDGEPTDRHRLAELGREGVLALFSDSTNAELPGRAGSETDVVPALEEIAAGTRGRLVVTTFSSSLHRIQLLVDLAARVGRRVALVGRGVTGNFQIAQDLGRVRIPGDLRLPEAEVRQADPASVLCIATGSQGEPRSALARIAAGEHRHVDLGPNDVVVFSARAIPGNRRAIGRVMNRIARLGATVVDPDSRRVHVSGHAGADELASMLSLVKPHYFVPIHGEYRYLVRHAALAEQVSGGITTVLLGENGHRVCFDAAGGWTDERAATGRIYLDGARGAVTDAVLRERRRLAGDGVVVPVVALDGRTGRPAGTLDLTTRGLVMDERTRSILNEVPALIGEVMASASAAERDDRGLIRERVRIELQRLFRRRAGRRPEVLPVIMER